MPPSRKRSQGKARKSQKGTAKTHPLRQFIEQGPLQCHHGLSIDNVRFLPEAFLDGLYQALQDESDRLTQDNLDTNRLDCPRGAALAVISNLGKRFPTVWGDVAKLNVFREYLLFAGAQIIVRGNFDNHLSLAALFARAAELLEIELTPSTSSMGVPSDYMTNRDAAECCTRSLIKFFLKRLPCNCLVEGYVQAKSQHAKSGRCDSCLQVFDRSSLYACGCCKMVQYVSLVLAGTDIFSNNSLSTV